jgi:hypothetical protein
VKRWSHRAAAPRPGRTPGEAMKVSEGLAHSVVLDATGGEHRLAELWQYRPAVLALIRHFG